MSFFRDYWEEDGDMHRRLMKYINHETKGASSFDGVFNYTPVTIRTRSVYESAYEYFDASLVHIGTLFFGIYFPSEWHAYTFACNNRIVKFVYIDRPGMDGLILHCLCGTSWMDKLDYRNFKQRLFKDFNRVEDFCRCSRFTKILDRFKKFCYESNYMKVEADAQSMISSELIYESMLQDWKRRIRLSKHLRHKSGDSAESRRQLLALGIIS